MARNQDTLTFNSQQVSKVSALYDTANRLVRGKPFEKGNSYAWKPGQTGNPAGRPKFGTLSEAIRTILAQAVPNESEGRSYADLIAGHLIKVAAGIEKGNSTRAAHEIAN